MLIRLALEGCGQVINQAELEEELALIECMYLGDGWYMDGKTTQRDYYISFAFHYYSLIYVKFMRERDPIRAKRFTERAVMFAQDYLYYFDEEGEALPYGRSQTYRFAQEHFRSFDICRSRGFTLGTNKNAVSKTFTLLDATGYFHL